MPKLIDITGQRFGRLTVLEYEGNQKWRVQCDCGTIKTMLRNSIISAHSCGCERAETMKEIGRRQQNMKTCTVCGKEFPCPPSSKTCTCSKECSRKWRSITHTGHKVTERTREKISQKAKEKGLPDTFDDMQLANSQSEKCQRGTEHSAAKEWQIENVYTHEVCRFVNVREWVRENISGFDRLHDNLDRDVTRIAGGFYTIKRNLLNGQGCVVYKGWRIIGYDDRTNSERGYSPGEVMKKEDKHEEE